MKKKIIVEFTAEVTRLNCHLCYVEGQKMVIMLLTGLKKCVNASQISVPPFSKPSGAEG